MQTYRSDRKVETLVSMHLRELERSYKCQIVTDTKSCNTSHIVCKEIITGLLKREFSLLIFGKDLNWKS